MKDLGLFYVLFMDDWIVIAPTRWKLQKAVKRVNGVLAGLKVEKHPDKTFIGWAERGFDFLGYHLRPREMTVAEGTLKRFVDRVVRLYKQEPGEILRSSRLGQYVKRWTGWVSAGKIGVDPAEMYKKYLFAAFSRLDFHLHCLFSFDDIFCA